MAPVIAAIIAAMTNETIRGAMQGAAPLLLTYTGYFLLPPAVLVGALRMFGRRLEYPTLVLLGLLSALTAFAGVAQIVAALLLAGVAMVIGGKFLGPRQGEGADASGVLTTTLGGFAIAVGFVAWLLPLAIHRSLVYIAAALTIIYFGRSGVGAMIQRLGAAWASTCRAHPWSLGLAVAIAGLASLFLWMPSLNYDDNSGHLILANQMLSSGYYRMDVSTHVGAVSPWFNNVLHACLSVISGGEARSAVGTLWLLFGCTGSYRVARSLSADTPTALLAAALYASHPLTAYFGTTLQVDGASAACLLHLLSCTLDALKANARATTPALFGALMGILAAMKITNMVYLAPMAIALLWQFGRQRKFRDILVMGSVAAAVAGSSYAYAQVVTGNPLFPFYNAIFRSPYMPAVNFADTRWHSGVSLTAPWDITFATSEFMEAYPGAAGLALVALAGGFVLALVERSRASVAALICAAVGLFVFWQVQYLRYVFPAVAVLATISAVVLVRHVGHRVGFAAIVLIVVAQSGLIRTTSWMFNDGAVDHLVRTGPSGLKDLERKYVPERPLIRRLASNDQPFCLLLASRDAPYVSVAAGQAISLAWYDVRMSSAANWADQDPSGQRWKQVLSSTGISHVETRSSLAHPPLQSALDGAGFEVVDRVGDAVLWWRSGADPHKCLERFFKPRDESRRLLQN